MLGTRPCRLRKKVLEQLALEVKQRSKDIQDMVEAAAKIREDGETALSQASKLQEQHSVTTLNIKAELEHLRGKQRQMAQERLTVAKEKAAFESRRDSALCAACSNPLLMRSSTPAAHYPAQVSPILAGVPSSGTPGQHMSAAARNLSATLATFDSNSSKPSQVCAAIQMDHSIRMWSLAANKVCEALGL